MRTVIDQIRAGLPVNEFDHLGGRLHVSAEDLAKAVGIPVRTLARRRREGRLQKNESDRLVRIQRLFDRAIDVMGTEEDAANWLNHPQRGLGGEKPLDLADTEPGAREVENLLGRIEEGVFS